MTTNYKINCAFCTAEFCEDEISKTPKNCPRREMKEELIDAKYLYENDLFVKKTAIVAADIETEGYREWPRVQELVEFAKRMEFTRLGIAFCTGLHEEASSLCKILENNGFDVDSICCAVDKGCNPVGQAKVLNSTGTQLNIIVGLCIGHDVLFTRFSDAPVTTLVVKDRVTCHNPAAPLMNRYWRDSFYKSK